MTTSSPSMTSYHDGRLVVWGGDCLALMAAMAPDSVDAIVTDPPYGLGFMGKKWDDLPPGKEWAEACYRVLKPGGHILAFGGTRTWHRLAVAIEDGGFEIRDSLAWLYGSGFPKSMDVSKAIDKAAGAERAPRGGAGDHEGTVDFAMKNRCTDCGKPFFSENPCKCPRADKVAITPEAQQWEGWGTALKPAFEPIVVGRKPLGEKTVAANVLAHGTGALNIDGCRIEGVKDVPASPRRTEQGVTYGELGNDPGTGSGWDPQVGRWPANVILDESQAEALDRQAPKTGAAARASGPTLRGEIDGTVAYGARKGLTGEPSFHGDIGGASRFFYCAKAPKSERPMLVLSDGTKLAHPTVKPLAVMRWLVRLVTPPGGLVLDTFAGTGTTGEACVLEGFRCLLAEDPTKGEQDYLPLIDQRITRAIAALPTKVEVTVA